MSCIMRCTDTDSVMVIICNLILIKFDPTFNILPQVGVQWKVESLVFANTVAEGYLLQNLISTSDFVPEKVQIS